MSDDGDLKILSGLIKDATPMQLFVTGRRSLKGWIKSKTHINVNGIREIEGLLIIDLGDWSEAVVEGLICSPGGQKKEE